MARGPAPPGRAGTARAGVARVAARTPLVTSAGALVDALNALGAKRVALLMPYAPALADQVADYIRGEGFDVAAQVALNIVDNVEVG